MNFQFPTTTDPLVFIKTRICNKKIFFIFPKKKEITEKILLDVKKQTKLLFIFVTPYEHVNSDVIFRFTSLTHLSVE